MDLNFLQQNIWILAIALIFDLTLRGYALWFSAGRKQKYWFIALLIVNSLGILPIIYLLLNTGRHDK